MLSHVHAAFNHASIERLRATISRVKGVDHLISTSAVIPFCDACVLGKHTRKKISNKHARVAVADSSDSLKPYLHSRERCLSECGRKNDQRDGSVASEETHASSAAAATLRGSAHAPVVDCGMRQRGEIAFVEARVQWRRRRAGPRGLRPGCSPQTLPTNRRCSFRRGRDAVCAQVTSYILHAAAKQGCDRR